MFEQSSPPVHQIWGSPILPLQHISSNGHYMPTSGYVLSNPRNPSLEGFLRDGTILSWAEFEELAYLKTHPQTISRFIHVQAWTMDVKLENHKSRDESRKSCLYHVVQTSHGQQYNKVEFMNEKFEDLETEELRLLSTKTYTAILVSGIERLFKPLEGMYFMLVEIKTDHAERVGILKLEKDFQWWALKNRQWLNPGIASKKEIDVDGLKLQWKETRLG
ncbi:uncharacterized protein LTHEOB_147 [Lasiodiplodia theobromae]|uniref:uncharacterized protein n=1 Tax=Lasiodiplodia theobromae TaxID=45133 RepID=UPI0015C3481A|nr:uncharacterized protein LTHEOB_147 [Lasiodiplodia theobromae]KAF4543448.1 hypothetical protein LTHEOB_147 [Lasiodiplodia theobromae]